MIANSGLFALGGVGLRKMSARWLIALTTLGLSACASTGDLRVSEAEFAATEAVLKRDITTLASVEFHGRRPGTLGQPPTLEFIESELARAGLVSGTNDPANPWRAPVPLITTRPIGGNAVLTFGSKEIAIDPAGMVARTSRSRSLVEGAELLFAGRAAANIPDELVRGRVVIIEGVPGKSPAWRSKLFEQGAAAAITVLSSQGSIDRMRRSSRRSVIRLRGSEDDELNIFASGEAMRSALEKGGVDVAALEEEAAQKGFTGKLLEGTAHIEAMTDRREIMSYNVIGKMPGTRPDAGAILLLAHWDHFGDCDSYEDRGQLCAGAADNASGVASMIELARRMAASGPHDRDIYVLATTAEEWGLHGARYFADNPPIPLDNFIAAFNFDTVAIAPRGSAVGIVGEGRTELDPLIRRAIRRSGREQGETELAEQFVRRQDGWALLDKGVPTVVVSSAFGDEASLNAYLSDRYHSAADTVDALEMGGAVEDLILHEHLLKQVASVAEYPRKGD